jgi:uroporphyrinogen-III decarboxylase
MPITMMLACQQIGARYRDYCTDYRVMVEGQIRTAEQFGFDYVNTMSDPAREAADCGATVQYFDHQPVAIVEEQALLADKTSLASLRIPDPLGGGRMHNGIHALALYRERVIERMVSHGGKKTSTSIINGTQFVPVRQGQSQQRRSRLRMFA